MSAVPGRTPFRCRHSCRCGSKPRAAGKRPKWMQQAARAAPWGREAAKVDSQQVGLNGSVCPIPPFFAHDWPLSLPLAQVEGLSLEAVEAADLERVLNSEVGSWPPPCQLSALQRSHAAGRGLPGGCCKRAGPQLRQHPALDPPSCLQEFQRRNTPCLRWLAGLDLLGSLNLQVGGPPLVSQQAPGGAAWRGEPPFNRHPVALAKYVCVHVPPAGVHSAGAV